MQIHCKCVKRLKLVLGTGTYATANSCFSICLVLQSFSQVRSISSLSSVIVQVIVVLKRTVGDSD